MFVPKEIFLHGSEPVLLNGTLQSVSKLNDRYTVSDNVVNENNGNNYELVPLKKPVAGKVYFVTNLNNFDYISELNHYILQLDEETYLFWNYAIGYYELLISDTEWKYYYEVTYSNE